MLRRYCGRVVKAMDLKSIGFSRTGSNPVNVVFFTVKLGQIPNILLLVVFLIFHLFSLIKVGKMFEKIPLHIFIEIRHYFFAYDQND